MEFDNQLHRALHIINTLELSTFYPLILYILHDIKAEDIEKYLKALEKYVIRRAIANKTTKNYNKGIKNFIKDINSLISASNDDTNDTEIYRGLQNISNNKANLILFWIELYRRKNPNYDMKELKYTLPWNTYCPRNGSSIGPTSLFMTKMKMKLLTRRRRKR